MQPLILTIPLKPVPASRPRVPRWGNVYYSKTYTKWMNDAKELVPVSDLGLEEPLEAEVIFAIPRAKTSKLIVPVGDGDNLEKATYDLITERGYLGDDKWIVKAKWRKLFLSHGNTGMTYIQIRQFTGKLDVTLDELAHLIT